MTDLTIPPAVDPTAGRRYFDTARTWMALGYSVVPSADGKKPVVRWGEFSAHAKGKHRRPTRVELRRWFERHGAAPRGCLILDSHRDPSMHLAVIDIDKADLALRQWAESEFGVTPLVVTSGRGWHLVYRAPGRRVRSSAGMIGPKGSFVDGVSPIDVKGSAAYTIAAGSWHTKRGRAYEVEGDIELSEGLIRSLPVFDAGRYEAMVAETKKARQEAKRGSAADPHTSSSVSTKINGVDRQRGSIRSDVVVRTESGAGTIATIGSALAPGSYVQVFCPNHSNTDSPAASLRASGGGLRLTCFGACSTTWSVVDPVLPADDDDDLDDLFDTAAPSTADPSDLWGGAALRRYRRYELTDGQYLPHDPLNARLTLLRAGLGTGKTALAAHLADQTTDDVIVVAPRRSLVDDVVGRFGGRVTDYRAEKRRLTASHAVCLDSLHRVSRIEQGPVVTLTGRPIGLLVLDEIRTIRHAITSGCMDGYEALRALNALRRCLTAADRILIADALAEPVDLQWVDDLAGIDLADCEVRVAPAPRAYRYQTTADETAVRAQVRGWVEDGQRLAIPMMASHAAEALGREITEWSPGADVCVITADTIEQLEKSGRALRDINQWIKDVDHLIYSPSLGTGFSINIRSHFDRIVAMAWQGVGAAQDLAQMLHRVRHPREDDVLVWIRRYGSRPTHDPAVIETEWRENLDQTLAAGQAASMAVDVPTDPRTGTPYDDRHWSTAVQVESDRRRWGARGGLDRAFVELAGREGWTVEEWSPPTVSKKAKTDLRESKKEARKAVEKTRARALVAADVISIEAADKVREARDRTEALAVERARLVAFYGIDPDALTVEDVLRDDRGRRRRRVAAYGQAALLHAGHGNDLLRRDLNDVSKKGGSVRLASAGGRARSAWAVVEVLNWYGVDVDRLFADPHTSSSGKKIIGGVDQALDQSTWADAANKAAASAPGLRALGLNVRGDIAEKPASLLGAVLRRLGLELRATRRTRRVGGEVTRTWSYTIEGVEQMRADSAAYRERMRPGLPAVIDRLCDELLDAA